MKPRALAAALCLIAVTALAIDQVPGGGGSVDGTAITPSSVTTPSVTVGVLDAGVLDGVTGYIQNLRVGLLDGGLVIADHVEALAANPQSIAFGTRLGAKVCFNDAGNACIYNDTGSRLATNGADGLYVPATIKSGRFATYLGNNSPVTVSCTIFNTATGSCVQISDQGDTLRVDGGMMLSIENTEGTRKMTIDKDGALWHISTDSTGTPGAATIDKPMGFSCVASGASSVVITNKTVNAGSLIQITPMSSHTVDCAGWYVTRALGTFTLTCPAGNTIGSWCFGWHVKNPLP